MDVKKAIRERSIPLESSECRKVSAGDLVLCFRVYILWASISTSIILCQYLTFS